MDLPYLWKPYGNGELTVLSPLPGLGEIKVRGRRPSLPAGQRLYAGGAIHGRLDLLDELLARIEDDIAVRPSPNPPSVFLGDYIDRGPPSLGTGAPLIQDGTSHELAVLE